MHSRKTNFLEESPTIPSPPHSEPPRPRRRLFLFLTIAGFLFLSGCIARTFVHSALPDDPLAYDPVTLEPIAPQGLLKRIKRLVFNQAEPLAGHTDDRINILLLGMGGPGHDGPFLTDTMILASIQPSTGQLAMISIPRDLGVNIPGHGWYKINHANAFGEAQQSGSGGAVAAKVVADTFHVDVHYYIRVDFKAVEEVIDDVGGLTINVERSFTDTEYPADNYEYQTISFQKGIHDMDGDMALKYARSRHGNNGEGSDFARAKRQQQLILALKEKVLSFETLANPIKIHSIIETLGTHISTNLDFSDIISMMKLAKDINFSEINTVVLDTSIGGYLKEGYSTDGAFILSPVSGNFDDISSLIANIFDPDVAAKTDTIDVPTQEVPVLPPTTIEVLNGTWRAGLAARTKKTLDDAHITVTTLGNTDERPVMQSGVYVINPAGQDAAQAIKATLDIPIKKLSADIPFTAGSDVVIMLGEDFEE